MTQFPTLPLLPYPRVVQRSAGTYPLTSEHEIRETLDGYLSAEAYVLDVDDDGVAIRAGDDAGLFYGRQTLLQLLPPGSVTVDGSLLDSAPGYIDPLDIPHVHIEDAPAYRWRGFMLDVARHFLPADFVLKTIDRLAAHKLNVLHLHLTDDQGWRIPIPEYPRLTEVGGWRPETIVGFDGERENVDYDGVPHGGAYTREELERIVVYAAERHIEVVPEIDLPGHMAAALAAYPELGSGEPAEVWRRWGISTRILNVEEPTLRFVRAVLAEVASIFPSRYVHTGGDEVPKREWRASTSAQRKIADLGLADEEALQGWFTAQLGGILSEHDRQMVAWDEVVDGHAPTDTLVMAWRSAAHGIHAVRAGYDVVMAPSEHVYLDHAQSTERFEPVTFPHGIVSLRTVFELEPTPVALAEDPPTDEPRGTILGAQANLWTEYVPTTEHAEYMMFPRVCALAEAVWRQPLGAGETRDFEEFRGRLVPHLERLTAAGVRFRPLDD